MTAQRNTARRLTRAAAHPWKLPLYAVAYTACSLGAGAAVGHTSSLPTLAALAGLITFMIAAQIWARQYNHYTTAVGDHLPPWISAGERSPYWQAETAGQGATRIWYGLQAAGAHVTASDAQHLISVIDAAADTATWISAQPQALPGFTHRLAARNENLARIEQICNTHIDTHHFGDTTGLSPDVRRLCDTYIFEMTDSERGTYRHSIEQICNTITAVFDHIDTGTVRRYLKHRYGATYGWWALPTNEQRCTIATT